MTPAGIGREAALDALGPILRTTTENVLTLGPEGALTGPIRRGDAGTIRRHLDAVESASAETRALYVAAGLRTVRRCQIHNWAIGSARQPQLLGLGAKIIPRRDNFLGRGFLFEAHGNRFGVTVFHRHAIALRAHGERSRFDVRSL